jgi:hypothetical protein
MTRVVMTVGVAVALLAVSLASAGASTDRPWVEMHPMSAPPARAAQAMAYDPASKTVVVNGGYDDAGYRDDTWTWDGLEWNEAPQATPPAERASAGMAYDRPSRTLVMYGGFDGHRYLGDTWIWDGTSMTWSPAYPSTQPPSVTGPMLFTDPVNGHVDMIGGFDGRLFQYETWQWTGIDWQKLSPDGSPTARGAAVASPQHTNRTVVMFGGLGDLMTWDTWTWDGSTWTDATPAVQPPQRFYSASAFDPGARGVIVFGGGSASGDLADTWVWTGSTWKQEFPSDAPTARESPGMAFDRATNQLVLFGGDVRGTTQADTWTM